MKKSTIIESTIKTTYMWPQFRKLKLSQNMRLINSSDKFNKFLMDIGNGTTPTIENLPRNTIEIPHFIKSTPTRESLINNLYSK